MTQEQVTAVFVALQGGAFLPEYLKDHPEITENRGEVAQELIQKYGVNVIRPLLRPDRSGNLSRMIDRKIKKLAAMPRFTKKKGVIRKAFNDMIDAI